MDIYISLLTFLFIYSLLFLLDKFYKTCAHYPYIQFLKGTGLEIKFLRIKWQTTALNRTFLRWGGGHSAFFNLWFTVGSYVTLILLPVSILLLFATVYQTLIRKSGTGPTNSVMEPIIPGVNLPASELGYYSFTLIVSSIIHEIGHALAAVREDVHISNVGVNFFFILPVAYVTLHSDDIQKLNQQRSLRVFCAGVWHNVVLGLFAYVIYLLLPIMFSSFFIVNNGLIITNLHNSPLSGSTNGLFVDDIVLQINDCIIKDYKTWTECIQMNRFNKPGFCVSADAINRFDETTLIRHISDDEVDCCTPGKISSVCFESIEHNSGIVEIPSHMCLPVRPVIEKSIMFCNSELHCPTNTHCIKPLLNNSTNILRIACKRKVVIYMGHSYDLLQTVEVSQYIPKYSFLPSYIPDVIEMTFIYLSVFSLGFAVVNVIPCLAMDGQHITNTVLNIVLGKKLDNSNTLSAISLCVSLCGTILLFSLAIHTIWVHLPL